MPEIKRTHGNPIIITNTASAPFQEMQVFGKTTQNGAPTPDAPASLTSAGESGSITTLVAGANLIQPGSSRTNNGITFVWGEDGTLTISGRKETTGNTAVAVFSLPVPLTQCSAVLALGNKETVGGSTMANGINLCLRGGNSSTGFVYTDRAYAAEVQASKELVLGDETYTSLYVRVGENVDTVDNLVLKPQLNIGDIPLAWEAYKGQLLTLSTPDGLKGIPVSAGGNYTDANGQQWLCDEIDLERGVHVQRIVQRVFDGSENWSSSTGNPYYSVALGELGEIYPNIVLCDRFVRASISSGTNAIGINVLTSVSSGYMRLAVRPGVAEVTDVASWQAWLATHPITVQYALTEPVETALGAEDIAGYKAITAQHPVTTIVPDAPIWISVAYIYQRAGFSGYWTAPKMNWKNGDYFNLAPDYARIKGNILYVKSVAESLYRTIEMKEMPEYTIDQYAGKEFLNNIVENVQAIADNTILPLETAEMPLYIGNGPGWTAADLNRIERNLLDMKNALMEQFNIAPRLEMKMGIGGLDVG